jgi:hypothetical protein
VTDLVDAIRDAGFAIDFSPNKLRTGHGDVPCAVLMALADHALEASGWTQQSAQWADADQGGEEESLSEGDVSDDLDAIALLDEAPAAMEAFASGDPRSAAPSRRPVSAVTRPVSAVISSTSSAPSASPLDSLSALPALTGPDPSANPAVWASELEWALTKLKQASAVVQRDWGTQVAALERHHALLRSQADETVPALSRTAADIQRQKEKITSREKYLASQLSRELSAFSASKRQHDDTVAAFSAADTDVSRLTASLDDVVEQLASLKSQTSQHGQLMSDTAPLLDLKAALAQLRKDLEQLDLQIGYARSRSNDGAM